ITVGTTKYTTTADDVTGAFEISNASVSGSTTVKIDVTRKSLKAATTTHNMASGNIDTGEQPTNPVLPTDPKPTQPTTQPTTKPTNPTQPTTKPTDPTQPSNPVSGNLAVTATSNFFPSSSKTVSVSQTPICVEFELDASMGVMSTEWELLYDETKLSLVTAEKDFMPSIAGETVKYSDGSVYGMVSNMSETYNFSGGKTFVRAYFNIVGDGYTTVDLRVKGLNVGYIGTNFLPKFQRLVMNGVIYDITGNKGFENFSYDVDTYISAPELEFKYGDINQDDKIDINDATYLQLALTKTISLNSNQKQAADVNHDGDIDINDVTVLQYYLAKIINAF
ncbi:MAG: dockerin type I repeat-containing protein, partial [Ruminococcus sp.]|nr:dockerin type I repeat-containing protein [Ruminococcus sp.]